jgi:hypothetical protein
MGNYFSEKKQSSNDNNISSDCSVNVFVDKKSFEENGENIQSEQGQTGGSVLSGDNDEITIDEEYTNPEDEKTASKNKRRRHKRKKNNVPII